MLSTLILLHNFRILAIELFIGLQKVRNVIYGVKIAMFLLQNYKNCPAAGASPQAPFTATKYLVTMSRL